MKSVSPIAVAIIFFGISILATMPPATSQTIATRRAAIDQSEDEMKQHPYVGVWVTADGRVRQELLANGRYDEARGSRKSAYQGRYAIDGSHIDYWDDTGFTADGEFVNLDELCHGGMVFFREK
jgi:hypothetical protein